MLDKVASFITNNRGKLFASMLFVLIWMGLLTRSLKFDGSFNGFILDDNATYITSQKIGTVFGLGKPVFIKIIPEETDCRTVYTGLRHLEKDLHALLPGCPLRSVRNVISGCIPSERYGDSFSSVLQTIATYPLFKDLVSKDKRSCLMVLNTLNDTLFNQTHFDSLLAGKYEGIREIKAISLYHIESSVSESIRKDLLLLSSLISLFFAGYILFAYRNGRAILFAAVIIGTCVAASFFFFSVLGYDLNQMTTLAIPVLVVISLSDVVHLLSGYAHMRSEPNASERIKQVIKLYIVPSFFSSATTSSAFLSFYIFNESSFIRQFGLITAIVVMFEFFVTYLLAPFLLQFINLKQSAPAVLTGLARFFDRYQKAFTIGFIIFMAGSFAFIGSLRYHTDLDMFYPIGSKTESLHHEFTRDFYTNNAGDILIEPQREGIASYDSLARAVVTQITQQVESRRDVASVNSAGKDYYVPTAIGIPVNVLSLLGRSNPYVSADGKYFRIQIYFKQADDALNFSKELKRYAQPWQKELKMNFASSAALVAEMDQSTASSLFNSLFLSGLFIAFVLFLLTRSVPLTLISFVPNMIPLASVIYMFYFGGMDINILTAISAVICLGLLDDDTVHILYRKLIKQQPLEEVSVSILSTSVLLSGGFAFFMLSSFTPTRTFGLICAIVFFIGVISEITATAYLIGLLKNRHDKRTERKAAQK